MSVPLMAEFQEFASPVVPDRADQPVSETTERFLRAIVDRIPIERIEELHLFSPLRQGTVETGIAVVAGVVLVPDVPVAEPEPSEPLELSLSDDAGDAATEDAADATSDDAADAAVENAADATVEDAAGASVDDATEPAVEDAAEVSNAESEIDAAAAPDDDDPYAAEPPYTDAVAAIDFAPAQDAAVDDEGSGDAAVPEQQPEMAQPEMTLASSQIERHTVYTARYRLVIKGPDRGRWEADLVEEADAPLITVETVVRGVQRRAGEDTEIVRYNAAQIARALRIPQR